MLYQLSYLAGTTILAPLGWALSDRAVRVQPPATYCPRMTPRSAIDASARAGLATGLTALNVAAVGE
jgi:hypothetical protein